MDPYLKRYNNYVNIPEILTIFLVLEWHFGEMLPRTSVRVFPGPSEKR
jgi:hypothetical protein